MNIDLCWLRDVLVIPFFMSLYTGFLASRIIAYTTTISSARLRAYQLVERFEALQVITDEDLAETKAIWGFFDLSHNLVDAGHTEAGKRMIHVSRFQEELLMKMWRGRVEVLKNKRDMDEYLGAVKIDLTSGINTTLKQIADIRANWWVLIFGSIARARVITRKENKN